MRLAALRAYRVQLLAARKALNERLRAVHEQIRQAMRASP